MRFRKSCCWRCALEPLEPRRMLSASPAAKPAPIQVQYEQGQSLTALYSTVDPTGSIYTVISITAANDTQQQTGSPLATDDQTSLGISILNVATGEPILQAYGVSGSQTLTISSDLHSAHLTTTILMVDAVAQANFNAALTLSFTAPKSVATTTGPNPNETTLSGDGQNNTLDIIRNAEVDGTVTGTVSVTNDPDFPNTTFYWNSTSDVPADDSITESDDLTISALPPSPTSALAAISTIQGQNNLGGLAGGIGAFQALLDQDALTSLPALKAFPSDASQLLDSAISDPGSVTLGRVTQLSADTEQSADASFDNGSATKDISAEATIARQTNLLPLPKSAIDTGNLSFSVQSPLGGDSTATGAANGGITIASDASSASESTTVSLPATDPNGNSLGNVSASAKLNWKQAPGAASFEYDVTGQSSSTGTSVEYSDQITFPATVTGKIAANLASYVQPPLASGSLSQSADLLIVTATPAPPARLAAPAHSVLAANWLPLFGAADEAYLQDSQTLAALLDFFRNLKVPRLD